MMRLLGRVSIQFFSTKSRKFWQDQVSWHRNLQKGFFVAANFRPSYRWFTGKNHYPESLPRSYRLLLAGMLPDAHHRNPAWVAQYGVQAGINQCATPRAGGTPAAVKLARWVAM